MSEDERLVEIGRLVTSHQKAKSLLACLRARAHRYSEAARRASEIYLANGERPQPGTESWARHKLPEELLSFEEGGKFLAEIREARAEVARLAGLLDDMGVKI